MKTTSPSDFPLPDQFTQKPVMIEEWAVKEEIFLDAVTEEWGELISARALERKFYGIYHQPPVMEYRFIGDQKYLLSSITSSLLMENKKPNPAETYESHMVCCETATQVITGNFDDLEVAIAWIEGMFVQE
jgi:hypothetical protein